MTRELVLRVRSDLARRVVGNVSVQSEGCGLRFTEQGGPVVVVIGLHGGAGTSTLAYALAAKAAEESPAPVVLCETDASSGDVARLTGVVSPFGMSELALELKAGRMKQGGALAGKLRVIAGPPQTACVVSDEALVGLVDVARKAHGLVVIDAGEVRHERSRMLARHASHVVWVSTTRGGAADRARAWLAGSMPLAQQALAVRGQRGREAKGLREVAGQACDRLVLIQDSPGVNGHVELGERRMLSTLTGLAGFLT